jgi:hypothetical protein
MRVDLFLIHDLPPSIWFATKSRLSVQFVGEDYEVVELGLPRLVVERRIEL